MRRPAALAALTLATAACQEAPTSPYARPAGPAPSGLPATLRITASTGTPLAGPAIAADGDSLVASAEYDASGCLDYTAVAGTVNSTVVVTIIETTPSPPQMCALVKRTAVFHAVVRPAPRGAYAVVLRQRLEWPSDGPVERERARGSVTLP